MVSRSIDSQNHVDIVQIIAYFVHIPKCKHLGVSIIIVIVVVLIGNLSHVAIRR